VHIDGHEINTLHPVELRSHIGIMPQEPFLFAGTLKDNIEIGINIGKERLIKLLKMTGLDELVSVQVRVKTFKSVKMVIAFLWDKGILLDWQEHLLMILPLSFLMNRQQEWTLG